MPGDNYITCKAKQHSSQILQHQFPLLSIVANKLMLKVK